MNIDYVGSVDGVEFEGGSTQGNGTEVTIGVTQYIDDFLEQLIGHKPGESFDVEVTFPDEYPNNEDLAGKDAVFAVTVNYIVEQVTPELTDDFVQENLKGHLRLVDGARRRWIRSSRICPGARAQSICGNRSPPGSQISELPQSMVDYQFNRMLGEYQQMADSYGMTLDEAFSMVGVADEEELRQQLSRGSGGERQGRIGDAGDRGGRRHPCDRGGCRGLFQDGRPSGGLQRLRAELRHRRICAALPLNNRVLEYLVDNATFA